MSARRSDFASTAPRRPPGTRQGDCTLTGCLRACKDASCVFMRQLNKVLGWSWKTGGRGRACLIVVSKGKLTTPKQSTTPKAKALRGCRDDDAAHSEVLGAGDMDCLQLVGACKELIIGTKHYNNIDTVRFDQESPNSSRSSGLPIDRLEGSQDSGEGSATTFDTSTVYSYALGSLI